MVSVGNHFNFSFFEPVTAIPIDSCEEVPFVDDVDFAEVLEVLVEGDFFEQSSCCEDSIYSVPLVQAEAYSPSQHEHEVNTDIGELVTAVPCFDVYTNQSLVSFSGLTSPIPLSKTTSKVDSVNYSNDDAYYSYCQEVDGTRGAASELDWDIEEFQNYLYLQDIENIEEDAKEEAIVSCEETSVVNQSVTNVPSQCKGTPLDSEEVSLATNYSPVYYLEDYNIDSQKQPVKNEFSTNINPSYDMISVSQKHGISYLDSDFPPNKRMRNAEYEKLILQQRMQSQFPESFVVNAQSTISCVDPNKSRRQVATSRRERVRGKFKKNTAVWVSVTDMFDT